MSTPLPLRSNVTAVPPPAVVHVNPGRPPTSLATLVGRERELADLAVLLRDPAIRLVTLTGPGGVGKTRLALQIAETVGSSFPHGVRFVPLASVSDPDRVALAIAQVVGVDVAGREPLAERLALWAHDKRLLLILDNVEQVTDAADLIADVLAAGPGLRILVTSRIRLRLSGERAVPVAPLALPGSRSPAAFAELAESGAVQCFVHYARTVDHTFALTAGNGPAIAEICRRLDGLPLAIELSAAWINVLSPAALAAGLERRLPLLTRGRRDQPARQQTMRAAIAWSYDQLPPAEQALFRRLTVFAGGFTLDAAEAVGGQGGRGTGGQDDSVLSPQSSVLPLSPLVLDALQVLAEHSLLRWVGDGEHGHRYELLETLREYGLEQLVASGEEAAARQAHADWCLALAEEARPALLIGRDQDQWLARLSRDFDNLYAALTWFAETGDNVSFLRLFSAVGDIWHGRAPLTELRRWSESALRDALDAPALVRAAAHHVVVIMAGLLKDDAGAIAHGEAELAIAEGLGDPLTLGRAHFVLGMAWSLAGDTERAAFHFAHALPSFRQADLSIWIAITLSEYGDNRAMAGDLPHAVSLLDEALTLHRQLNFSIGVTIALGQRAHVALAAGEVEQAAHMFAESMEIAREIGYVRILQGGVVGLAGVALAHGQPQRAARLLGAVEAARESRGNMRPSFSWQTERIASQTRQALGEADGAASWEAGRSLPFETAMIDALALVGVATTNEPPLSTVDVSRLTARQRQVLSLLIADRTDREIAEALFLSIRTVEHHVAHILAKLSVRSRAEAVAAGRAAGLG